ncbi:MAG: PD-(D/E)XK nuclease family protein [Nanoarchaeota archaeon]
MVIKEAYFNHKGGMYIYRIHKDKIDRLCNGNFSSLKGYLLKMLNKCPHEYFNGGPRSSCLRFNLIENAMQIAGHEVSVLARHGLMHNNGKFKDKHSQVQTFMLENDANTIAMEVPIWLLPNELGGYKAIFNSNDVLTGHIDLIRIEGNKLWIWDYKPNANKEKYATTQTFFYAYMLFKRTGVPLEHIRCGYFDHNFAFVYKPELDTLLKLNKQRVLKS